MIIYYCIVFLEESLRQTPKSLPEWHQRVKSMLKAICLLCLSSSSERFCVTFCVVFCDTLYQEYFWLASAISTSGHDHEGPSMYTAVQLEKAVINHRQLKNALNQKWSSLKLKILDFAGDKEYHAYFHMFLRSQAIYVIVFNIAEFAEDSLRDLSAKIKSLHPWLESVCSHVPPITPLLLVGTHRGNMEQSTMERINDHLKENFWDLFCDELVLNKEYGFIFFPVENSLGQNDVGIQTFQRAIMATAEELKTTIGRNIPLSWIQIQDALISMKGDKGAKVCVMLEEFPTVFDNFICTNWTEETLKYFHEKGFIMYLDKEPKRVLLNPDILIDIIIKLVIQQPEGIAERGYRRHWNLLCNKGMLTEPLLESILSKVVQENKEDVTAFLEEYDLICPLTYQKAPVNEEPLAPVFFVPALLPISTDENTQLWSDSSSDKKFFVFFKKFLPEPFFHCLLSRAHKNSKVEFFHSQPLVFRDAGKFWLNPKQPYRLKLLKDMKMVEVTFTSRLVEYPFVVHLFMIVANGAL
ncbi:probable serine/threonine-protein kinase pats1 [Stylophora pistillata]|uniref:probable serine/threonine-protein kinase pats1 n=1 Tax=Stylophora pistillata TaxID=50429 RepID=UPI000C0468AB|nr:probable serine/threonine-protein kinase pats1 [Stylophora pistillata]